MEHSKKGFALLYAVLLTSIVLLAGMIASNIIYRQTVTATTGVQGYIAYYAAYTGVSCAVFWKKELNDNGGLSFDDVFDGTGDVKISCDGKIPSIDVSNHRFTVKDLNEGTETDAGPCFTAEIASGNNNVTVYGYNTCNALNPRRVIKILNWSI